MLDKVDLFVYGIWDMQAGRRVDGMLVVVVVVVMDT